MAQNIGTLVTAAIRPNDSLDLIASAFANEIKGGLHSVTSSTDRDAIITERREWGMLCSVINDNKTYKLKYGYSSTDITDNGNWHEFEGSGGGSSEWVDSVLSVLVDEPLSPSNGDRYLVGTSPTDDITGTNWSSEIIAGGVIAQWNDSGSTWLYTTPLNGMSVRVDNQYNSIYRYQGTYSYGTWYKEKESQVRYIYATSSNGIEYTSSSLPLFNDYDTEMIYVIKFSTTNTGNTMSLSINDLPTKMVKKTSGLSLLDVLVGDISTNYQYVATYNGVSFELKDLPNVEILNNKYYISSSETIIIPSNVQYFIYSGLTVSGTLNNSGEVIIVNGDLEIDGGTVSGSGLIEQVSFAQIDGLGQANYLPRWKSNYLLSPTSSIYDDGDQVNILSLTFSINSDFIIPNGASQGYVLTSDSDGNATWQKGITKFTATQSLVANFTYSVAHGLDSYSIIYNIWNETTGEPIIVSVKKTDLNTIDIMSTDTINNARIVIIS